MPTPHKHKNRNSEPSQTTELDSVYLLKLVLYLILGSIWIRLQNTAGTVQIPMPVGALVGLLLATHDHLKIDRKIEFAVLLVAMFISFWTQVGLYVTY